MKGALGLRPVFHHREDRIRAHVQLCWLALLLIRVVENATGDTWRNLRHELDRMHLVTLATDHGQVAQRSATTAGPEDHPGRARPARTAPVLRLHPPRRLTTAATTPPARSACSNTTPTRRFGVSAGHRRNSARSCAHHLRKSGLGAMANGLVDLELYARFPPGAEQTSTPPGRSALSGFQRQTSRRAGEAASGRQDALTPNHCTAPRSGAHIPVEVAGLGRAWGRLRAGLELS